MADGYRVAATRHMMVKEDEVFIMETTIQC